MSTTLRVVTTAAWLARDLAPGGESHAVDVVHDYGLDLLPNAAASAWWCSGGFAMRLAATGVAPRLSTPDTCLLQSAPQEFLRRDVTATTVADLPRLDGPRHVKPADVKVPGFPAQVHHDLAAAADLALAAGLGPDSQLLAATPIDLRTEWRVHVLDGEPVALSRYLHEGVTWDALDPATDDGAEAAREFAAQVCSWVRFSGLRLPRGYVLDIGATRGGEHVVIETNPAWSSNPYAAAETHPAQVVATILASQGPTATGATWTGDHHLAARARPLPVRTPV